MWRKGWLHSFQGGKECVVITLPVSTVATRSSLTMCTTMGAQKNTQSSCATYDEQMNHTETWLKQNNKTTQIQVNLFFCGYNTKMCSITLSQRYGGHEKASTHCTPTCTPTAPWTFPDLVF